MATAPIKVGIIVDWQRAARANCWTQLLHEMRQQGLKAELSEYPIADLLTAAPPAPDQPGLHKIRNEDVIIVNWDAVNGDPDFGADRALRWLEHRQPELIIRLRRGAVLIVESQTVLGVPCQAAYDAVAGAGELPVSGHHDRQSPMKFKEKTGAVCRKARDFPKGGAFDDVPDQLKVSGAPTMAIMFPGNASNILTDELGDLDWEDILYRGWFRRILVRSRELKWVSIIETSGRGRWKNHSVMQVAKVGRGAVFATTMMLATTRQKKLIGAMLECAGGNTNHLPTPASTVQMLRSGWKQAGSVVAGGVVGYFFSDDLARGLGIDASARDAAQSVLVVLFALASGAVFEAVRRLLAWSRNWWCDVIGY